MWLLSFFSKCLKGGGDVRRHVFFHLPRRGGIEGLDAGEITGLVYKV